MGKILTDAMALGEDLVERRRDHRRLGVVAKLGADAMHEIDRSCEDARAGRKAGRRIGADRPQHRHQRTRKDIADRRGRPEARRLEGDVANALPGRARSGARRRLARHLHARARIDAQSAMRGLDHDALGQGAEEITANMTLSGARTDLDIMRDQLLVVAAPRLQPQRAAGEADRILVLVSGDVTDVVDHASPVSFSGRLALGPCGK
ncbi:hypothetical protein ACVW04_005817 [Bradyrhizobium sp. LM2.3]